MEMRPSARLESAESVVVGGDRTGADVGVANLAESLILSRVNLAAALRAARATRARATSVARSAMPPGFGERELQQGLVVATASVCEAARVGVWRVFASRLRDALL